MKLWISHKRYNLIIYVGLPGIILLAGLFAALYVVTPSIRIEDARRRIRLSLQRELSMKHNAMLKQTGNKLPDYDMAKQWEKEINQINNLKFVSATIKRPFPDILLGFDTPTYVVRVVFLDQNQQHSTHYFWLSWNGFDRETSKSVWFFSI